MSRSFDPFQFYTREKKISIQAIFLRSLLPTERSLDTRPDFVVCEVDLDMEMNFLIAAPCTTGLLLLTGVLDIGNNTLFLQC